MSLVFLDYSVACLALVPVRDEHREQVSGGRAEWSQWGTEKTCEFVFVTLLPGLLAARFASG